ncbi:MAG: hypothetical protein KY447_10650 [Actinobacteria bacterium]|nr:hypothetical protein [Actinomycetota bacterium]
MAQRVTTRAPSSHASTRLVLIWLVAAVGLGSLLVVARAARDPLDDPDPALQRPGFLDAGELPIPAPQVAPAVPAPGHPTVVIFERAGRLAELCHALATTPLPRGTATAVLVVDSPSGRCDAAGTVVGDLNGTVAGAYGLRRPRGGGPPVGYAVVDAAGAIRYRTLDPTVSDELSEVGTILAALP